MSGQFVIATALFALRWITVTRLKPIVGEAILAYELTPTGRAELTRSIAAQEPHYAFPLRIEQRRFEETLGVPSRLRGWQMPDIEYAAGLHKADRLIAWEVSVGGPSVTAVRLDRARLPTVTFDPRAGRYHRLLPPKPTRAEFISFPCPARNINRRPEIWPDRQLRARKMGLDPDQVATVILARAGYPQRRDDRSLWNHAFVETWREARAEALIVAGGARLIRNKDGGPAAAMVRQPTGTGASERGRSHGRGWADPEQPRARGGDLSWPVPEPTRSNEGDRACPGGRSGRRHCHWW